MYTSSRWMLSRVKTNLKLLTELELYKIYSLTIMDLNQRSIKIYGKLTLNVDKLNNTNSVYGSKSLKGY